MAENSNDELCVLFLEPKPATVVKLGRSVAPDSFVQSGQIILTCKCKDSSSLIHVRAGSHESGLIKEVLVKPDEELTYGTRILKYTKCRHEIVMKDICAECGIDLRDSATNLPKTAAVSMVHNVPELMISMEQAQNIGKAEQNQLLNSKKLVLLVDLDQTLLHTTNDNIDPDMKDVFHFQLPGHPGCWYHTRKRPHLTEFLEAMNEYFEMHIITFGTRTYAHTIAFHLDPDKRFFGNRILSRDECFSAHSKSANLKALFPCGDNFVCIIDDREEVWNYAPNLIHVKPYHFFKHTGDINAPPGLDKKELDEDAKKQLSRQEQDTEAEGEEKLGETDDSEDGIADKPEEKDSESAGETTAQPKSDSSIINVVKTDPVNNNEEKENPDISDNPSSEDQAQTVPGQEVNDVPDEINVVNVDSAEIVSAQEDPISEFTKKEEATDSEKNKAEYEKEMLKGELDKKGKENGEKKLVSPEDTDDYLKYLEDILKSIHRAFYQMYEESVKDGTKKIPDLKYVIPYVRSKVLAGVNMVFSHVVPHKEVLERSRPYLVAKSLGANVFKEIVTRKGGKKEDVTTHVVAANPGTAKVRQAQALKYIKIVNPDWLWTSAERWEHVDERVFPLNESHILKKFRAPAHCTTPQIALMMSKPQKAGQQQPRPPPPELPVYDPVTGKRIRKNAGAANGAPYQSRPAASLPLEDETDDHAFRDSLNPLLSFSKEEIDEMSDEVESITSEDDADQDYGREVDDSRGSGDFDDTTNDAAEKLLANFDDYEEDEYGPTGDLFEEDHPHGWKVSLHHTPDGHFETAESDEEVERASRKRHRVTYDEDDDETINQKFRRGEDIPDDLEMGQPDEERDEISDVEGNIDYS